MRVRSTIVAVLSAGLVFAALAGDAVAAEGVLIAPSRLAAPVRTALVADIQKARKAAPKAFDSVADLRKALPEIDAAKRGRLPSITPALKAIGKDALFPMLEELAVDSSLAASRAALTETAWLGWRVSLLEATGMLRDPRAEAVLTAILDSPQAEFAIMKASAEALGRLGTDTAAAKLIAASKGTGAKQTAVLAGMGECRRTIVADALAKAVAGHPDADTAKHVVRSLGNVGSAWAWKTPVIAASGEEAAVRKAAAAALVAAFVAYDGEVRKKAGEAILVVDDPSTPALLTAAKKGAPADLQTELADLAARFAKNPIR
jgi:HEAT repeat protein